MTTANAMQTQGRILRSLESGITLAGAPRVWFNRSREEYDETHGAPFPMPGALVKLDYTMAGNGKFYVTGFEVLEEAEPGQPAAAGPEAGPVPIRDDRPVVTRLACLNAAVATYAAYTASLGAPDSPSAIAAGEAIIGLAEQYVSWATWGGHGPAVPTA